MHFNSVAKFVFRVFLFTLLILFIFIFGAFFLSKPTEFKQFANSETESNLLIFKENESYDIAFLGISHARNFSRFGNHARVEKIFNKRILNLGQGEARCGVNEQLFYLKYFYEHGVKIDTIVYVISPSLLHAGWLNKASDTFIFEPVKFDFFFKYINFSAENKYQRLFYYFRSKYSPRWLFHQPTKKKIQNKRLKKIDKNEVKKGLKKAYLDEDQAAELKKNGSIIEETIRTSIRYGSKFIIIIPPALFGKWKGHDDSINLFETLKNKYNFDYYDFSESILNPEYYFDHHHLNTEGVNYFCLKFLRPAL